MANFNAGSGNDTYTGDSNSDRVDYRDPGGDPAGPITQGVNVNLTTGVATDGWGDTDSLVSIERLRGTYLNDVMIGNGDRNDFRGRAGDDFFDGQGGDRDRVVYTDSPSAVTVDLAAGTASDGWGNTDTFVNIEWITGSEFHDDTLMGDAGRNNIFGFGGNDQIFGRIGDDFLTGGAGNDTLDGGAGDRDKAN